VGVRRARAQRQRRGGRAPRQCWAHRDAGKRPARRARAGDRPSVHIVRRCRAHSAPCAVAALQSCGRDVADDMGLGPTWRSTHRRQGRAANGGGTIGLRSSNLNACEAGCGAVAATTRGGACVRRQDRGRRGCLAACCVECCQFAPALQAGRAGNPVRCMCGGRWRCALRRVSRSACADGPGAIRQDCSSLRALTSWSRCGCNGE